MLCPPRTPSCVYSVALALFRSIPLAQITACRMCGSAQRDCADEARYESVLDESEAWRDHWEQAVGFEITCEPRDGKSASRIAAHHSAVDLSEVLDDEERQQLVSWGVSALIAMIDAMNDPLRTRAKALRGGMSPAIATLRADSSEPAETEEHALDHGPTPSL